nr:Cytoskeleton-associated protein domain containing protein [Haemonchus contortus]
MSFEIGARVETEKTGKGRVAFCGEVQFSDGEWVGVILDDPRGKNNGTVQGVQYFTCEPNHGLFIRPTQLRPESARTRASGLRTPAPRKEVAAPAKVARSSPSGSPKVSPSVSLERLSKAGGPKRVLSSSKLVDNANEPKMSREPSNLSQASSEKGDKQEKEKVPEKVVEKSPEKPESVMDKVKKLQESASPMTPLSPIRTTIPTGMDEGTEQEYLRLQVKDLSEKLETLRLKRKEDHGKLVDYERSKIQLQALMELKSKMADQLLDLQRQLQEARKEALESREWKEANQDELSSAAEQLEMATIDKEMAEERAEALQAELDSLKLRNEELEADLEILREEMAGGGGGVISEGNSVQLKQLELQNERLKEALIKLRDINAAAQAEKQAAVREAEVLRTENVELVRAAEIARKTALDSDMRIHDYQEQIEAAMGAEEMVMNLANKNMEMETQIRQLEADRDELEAHRDMDEQMLEEQKLVEKALLGEIEGLHIRINELQQRMKQEEDHRDELVSTIMKFRKKVGEQNEEIQELKDQVLRYQEELSGHKSEENSMASIVSQMQVNVNRTFAESVERQVAAIEVECARKQMGYLKQFLPDNFTKAGGDNDAVVLNVLFPRLASKAKLLTKLIAERFPGVPGGTRREHVTKSHKAEHWAHSARIAYTMNALVAVCGQFESALSNISLEDLSRLAQLQPEMTSQERVIDGYLELLKQSRLDAETSLENMEKVVTYFQNVLSVNVSADSYDTPAWLRNVCQQLVSGIAWCKVNNQRISFFLKPGLEGCDVSELVRTIGDELAQCEQLAIRAGKRVPTDNSIKLTPQVKWLNNLIIELDGFDSTRLKEMIHGEIEKTHGSITVEKTFEPISKYLWTLRENLSNIFNALESGSLEVEPKDKGFPPVLERAHLRKQAAAEAEGLRWQLEKKDMEILELKKTIKSRLDDISNYKLRLDMAEARIESAGKQDNVKVQHLEAKIEQLVADNKKKQIEFDETMDALQKELKECERENAELKQMAKNFSRKTLLENIQRLESRASPPSVHASSPVGLSLGREEAALLEQQLSDNREALRRATLQIVQLKADLALAQSRGGVMRLPDMVCGPETLRAKENDAVLEAISKEVEQLKRDELKYMVFIPDPSRSRHLQEQDKARFEKEQQAYNYRVQTLRARLHQYWKDICPGQPFPNLFALPPTTQPKVRDVKYGTQAFKDIVNNWGVKA